MSWFFGKKKHHRDSPPESPEEESAPVDEEFIFVEKKNEQSPDKPPNLYPSLSNVTSYASLSMQFEKQSSQEGQCNDLSCIPFKLCKELERSMNEDLVIDQLRLEEIVSFISRINVNDYDYSFSIEKSVIAEMESQREE